jgi:hypothetical protein
LHSSGVRLAEGVYAIKCAMHYYVHRLIEALQHRTTSVLNTFDRSDNHRCADRDCTGAIAPLAFVEGGAWPRQSAEAGV